MFMNKVMITAVSNWSSCVGISQLNYRTTESESTYVRLYWIFVLWNTGWRIESKQSVVFNEKFYHQIL